MNNAKKCPKVEEKAIKKLQIKFHLLRLLKNARSYPLALYSIVDFFCGVSQGSDEPIIDSCQLYVYRNKNKSTAAVTSNGAYAYMNCRTNNQQ